MFTANEAFYRNFLLLGGIIAGICILSHLTTGNFSFMSALALLGAASPLVIVFTKKSSLETEAKKTFALCRGRGHIVADFVNSVSLVIAFPIVVFAINHPDQVSDINKFTLVHFYGLLTILLFSASLILYNIYGKRERVRRSDNGSNCALCVGVDGCSHIRNLQNQIDHLCKEFEINIPAGVRHEP